MTGSDASGDSVIGVTVRLTSLERCAEPIRSPAWCSDAEVERANGIASATRRVQFLAGRWFARECLSERYGGLPGDWRLSCQPGRAPVVELGPATPCISLSHRFDALVCAIAPTPVGIDVELEHIRRVADPDELAPLMLSTLELDHYSRTAGAERAALLRALWTLKEAWAKTSSDGLTFADFPRVTAHPARPAEANARLWNEGKLTIALVVRRPGELARLDAGGMRDPAHAEPWRVGPVTEES